MNLRKCGGLSSILGCGRKWRLKKGRSKLEGQSARLVCVPDVNINKHTLYHASFRAQRHISTSSALGR